MSGLRTNVPERTATRVFKLRADDYLGVGRTQFHCRLSPHFSDRLPSTDVVVGSHCCAVERESCPPNRRDCGVGIVCASEPAAGEFVTVGVDEFEEWGNVIPFWASAELIRLFVPRDVS